ncbi:glycosyltransferase family 2 protein [Tunturibacter empetritectus]|uniref:Rhamnosyltransferase n=1 Tax=Tunturiibacter empetritectus TaxID=3069691 RepID=A0A7W8IJ91_9BACT|nr:glycosyltransferase [Edaphobacter lichenicola]MBB5317198.1 rhamnosyltransferase [Edaphobacter lichenicola]
MTCFVVIPTLNAVKDWHRLAPPLLESMASDRVLILDSSSVDGTADLAKAAGFRVHTIAKSEFNHGGTRQVAVELLPDAEVLVFLTQDVELAQPDAISLLLEAFVDPAVAAAYGRQLPRRSATPIEAHARLYNYPEQSSVRTWASREQFGFKTIFLSNSFAAYRRNALMAVGGFPCDVIFGEDTITAARLLMAGWKVAYVAEAQVYHSHNYTWVQEFKRYFDIGALHAKEDWLLDKFGRAGGEGSRFVRSELRYLWQSSKLLIPSALFRTVIKLAGYKFGSLEKKLSLEWKRRLSMHPAFWK